MFNSFMIKLALIAISLLMAMPFPVVVHGQDIPTQVGVFGPVQVAPGEVVQVPITVRNVQDLYGFDVIIEFDPEIVQVEDADPTAPDIQLSLGDFLDPGLLLFNIADNEKGTIRFTMSQYNPSEPKTGEGLLFVVRFRGTTVGESALRISFLQLATREGVEIPAVGVDSQISVISGVPVQQATLPLVESTAIIIVATETPTPTATEVPTNTATSPAPTQTPTVPLISITEAATTESLDSVDETTRAETKWLANNWWILPITAVLIMIPGVYLWVRSNHRKEK